MLKIDPFHISPNQLIRIKGALSLSAQQAHIPAKSAQKAYGAPGLFATFGQDPQTEGFPEPLIFQIPNLQPSSTDVHAIAATPPQLLNIRTKLPPAPIEVRVAAGSRRSVQ